MMTPKLSISDLTAFSPLSSAVLVSERANISRCTKGVEDVAEAPSDKQRLGLEVVGRLHRYVAHAN